MATRCSWRCCSGTASTCSTPMRSTILPTLVAVAEPLTPAADDEGAHPPADEPLWNESWYFDFADRAAGHRRLDPARADPQPGHVVDQRAAVRPGHPDLCARRLPRHRRASTSPSPATEPLRRTGSAMRGQGQAYDDPAALLRGEAGRPVELTMDLAWTTAGTPYQYRITPRYEIPCTVSGTVTVDGQEFAVRDVRRSARPLVGRARLVGHGLGVERTAPRRRHATSTASTCASPGRRRSASATSSDPVSRWSSCRRSPRERHSATTGYRWRPR